MSKYYSLGIDTSNYKTSVAIVDDENNIIFNESVFLDVKKGERGLRQSTALFQHINKLPDLISYVLKDEEIRNGIKCIGVSSKPRPLESSYMPVFLAGNSTAKSIASAMNVPLYTFSHQEGHIEAVKCFSSFKNIMPIIAFHFSGGTTEALFCNEKYMEIIGGTKDISFGQVLDRIGVYLGYNFPAGKKLDDIACSTDHIESYFSRIKIDKGFINLSGIETQAYKIFQNSTEKEVSYIVNDLFNVLSKAIIDIVIYLNKTMQINNFLFTGGVSSSNYIKNYITKYIPKGIEVQFGAPTLSSDNAVGIAILGGKIYGNQAHKCDSIK